MENMKTLALTGSEEKAEFSGSNAWLRNDSTDTVYAAKSAGVTAGADGVVAVPAGQSAPVYGANGTVFLLGTGSVQLIGSDYSTNPFKTSAQSGGSGADSVARAAISAHAGNTDIHVTAAEKAAWNAVNYSNPNLLINPDFRINQRGETSYTAAGYTVDGWYTNGGAVDVTENGVELTNSGTSAVRFRQNSEITHAQLAGRDITLSAGVGGTTYSASGKVPETKPANDIQIVSLNTADADVGIYLNYSPTRDMFYAYAYVPAGKSAVLNWVKAEIGSVATLFVPPGPATELAKCQRYYQIRTTNDVDPLDMRPSMRTITDIKQVTGGYAYVAEL